MVRTFLLLVIVGVLGYLGYYAYQTHEAKASMYAGDFSCRGCDSPEEHARFLKENAGDAEADASSKPAATAPAAKGAAPAAAVPTPAPAPSMVEPQAEVVPSPAAPVVIPTTPEPGATIAGVPPVAMPTSDTVAPNPPNGMTFAGKGTFQWYRQGNLTWRVDTTSGRSCIIYATVEEWRKQIVMSHGCGRTA